MLILTDKNSGVGGCVVLMFVFSAEWGREQFRVFYREEIGRILSTSTKVSAFDPSSVKSGSGTVSETADVERRNWTACGWSLDTGVGENGIEFILAE